VVVVVNSHCPRKQANVLIFDGRWMVVAAENNHRPQKQANVLIFDGRWKVVAAENNHRPRKQANMLIFDGRWKVVAAENNHRPRKQANVLVSEGLEGGGSGKLPPSKTSTFAHFRWQYEVVVVVVSMLGVCSRRPNTKTIPTWVISVLSVCGRAPNTEHTHEGWGFCAWSVRKGAEHGNHPNVDGFRACGITISTRLLIASKWQ
jgi:hypothetical protein